MSALPMKPPSGIDASLHAELMIALPPDWPLDGWDDERRYWPVHLLKTLARLPSGHNIWLATGHMIASGDHAEPYKEGVGFTGAVLLPPFDLPRSFSPLRLSDRAVSFYYIFPLYPEEMEYKLTRGLDALLNRLEAVGLGEDTPMINVRRPNSCR